MSGVTTILDQAHNTDASRSTFTARVDGNQNIYNGPSNTTATTTNEFSLIQIRWGCTSPLLSRSHQLQLTAIPAKRNLGVVANCDCDDVDFLIREAIVFIDNIKKSLINPTDASDSQNDVLHLLDTLRPTLQLTKRAVKAYKDKPLGQNLINAIIPDVKQCHLALLELRDNVNGTYVCLIYTRIGHLWHWIWGEQWDELASWKGRLNRSRNSLGMFLKALASVRWIELAEELSTGPAPIKKFHDLLQLHLSNAHNIDVQVDMIQVIDHLGVPLGVPILFCSTWKEFNYIINSRSKGRPGSTFIERGDYQILRAQDSQIVSPTSVVESGITNLEMSIVKRQSIAFKESCPRCGHINSNVTAIYGWIECRRCPGRFQVAQVEKGAEENARHVDPEGDAGTSQEGDRETCEGDGPERGEEGDVERSEGRDSAHDEDQDQEIRSHSFEPTGNRTRQGVNNEILLPNDEDMEHFRRIYVIF